MGQQCHMDTKSQRAASPITECRRRLKIWITRFNLDLRTPPSSYGRLNDARAVLKYEK